MSLLQTLCTKATMQTVRAADTNEVVKLIFRESDNDRKVSKWLIAEGGQPPPHLVCRVGLCRALRHL